MGIIGDEPAGARLQDQSYRDASNWIGMVDGSGETQADCGGEGVRSHKSGTDSFSLGGLWWPVRLG